MVVCTSDETYKRLIASLRNICLHPSRDDNDDNDDDDNNDVEKGAVKKEDLLDAFNKPSNEEFDKANKLLKGQSL